MPLIRAIRLMASETLEATWTLADGTLHVERYTCPPQATIDQRRQAGNAQIVETANGPQIVPREL